MICNVCGKEIKSVNAKRPFGGWGYNVETDKYYHLKCDQETET